MVLMGTCELAARHVMALPGSDTTVKAVVVPVVGKSNRMIRQKWYKKDRCISPSLCRKCDPILLAVAILVISVVMIQRNCDSS